MSSANLRSSMDQFVEFINTVDHQLEARAKAIISDSATFFVPGREKALVGPAGYIQILTTMRSGLPDIQWSLDQLVIEGEWVAARFRSKGTHLGTIFGVPATGKTIQSKAMNFYRFVDGKVEEEFAQPDFLHLLQQLGKISADVMPEISAH